MSDEPEPIPSDGPNVTSVGDMVFFQKLADRWNRRQNGECKHLRLTMDDEGHIITCEDCSRQVGAYWTLRRCLDSLKRQRENVRSWAARLADESKQYVVLRAAKMVEKAWRSAMVPICPHCHVPIYPEDGFGSQLVAKDRQRP